MKNTFLLGLLIFTVSSAHAYIKVGEEKIPSLQPVLKQASQQGIELSKHEKSQKNELLSLKKRNPELFRERMVENKNANPEEYQSFIYEVQAGRENVEKAKILARLKIFEAVKKDWNILKTTILNETGAEEFEQFKPILVFKLSNMNFAPIKKSDEELDLSSFRFKVEDWGVAVVSKDLKNVTWKVLVSAMHDNNKLEPGAENIRTIDKGSSNSSGDVGSEESSADNFEF